MKDSERYVLQAQVGEQLSFLDLDEGHIAKKCVRYFISFDHMHVDESLVEWSSSLSNNLFLRFLTPTKDKT